MNTSLLSLPADKWRTFERYPKEGALVIIHAKGYAPKERRNYHLFKRVKFHALKFNPYSIRDNSKPFTIWTYSWLYADEVRKK